MLHARMSVCDDDDVVIVRTFKKCWEALCYCTCMCCASPNTSFMHVLQTLTCYITARNTCTCFLFLHYCLLMSVTGGDHVTLFNMWWSLFTWFIETGRSQISSPEHWSSCRRDECSCQGFCQRCSLWRSWSARSKRWYWWIASRAGTVTTVVTDQAIDHFYMIFVITIRKFKPENKQGPLCFSFLHQPKISWVSWYELMNLTRKSSLWHSEKKKTF